MTFLSHAQNGEDVVLARAFSPDHAGFYIDVGASDPDIDSVTKHFYDQGWSGVNIEPALDGFAALERERARDVNLDVGLGREAGKVTLYELPRELTGCSTFSRELADRYASEGWEVTPREVAIKTLAEVCEEHAGDRTIDFLKIDVEGDEANVLAGADFRRFRPRIVVVEATQPGTTVRSHEAWEGSLLQSAYEFVLFDGLNRFYLRDEDADLAECLSAPANVLDDFLPARYERWRDEAEQSERWRRAAEDAEQRAREVEASLAQTRQQLARCQAELRDERVQLEAYRAALTRGGCD